MRPPSAVETPMDAPTNAPSGYNIPMRLPENSLIHFLDVILLKRWLVGDDKHV